MSPIKAYGNTYEYYPLITKDEYKKKFFKSFLSRYFGDSFPDMVSFFAGGRDLSLEELEEIRKRLNEEIEKQKGAKPMKPFLLYLVQSGLCLAVFFLIYELFLKRETFFQLNRIFLVSGLVAFPPHPRFSHHLALSRP